MDQLIKRLSEFRLFKGVSDEELQKILENHYLKITNYKDDTFIRVSNERANYMYLVLEGAIKGTMQDVDGHIYLIEEFQRSEMVAPANLFSLKETFPVSLISKGDTSLIQIEKKTLVNMFKISERLEENLLELLSDKVQFLANKLWENQFYSIEQRIYRMILNLYQTKGVEFFEIPYTHEELSHKLGVSRPSFSRALIKINQDGVVLFKNKKVEIISVDKLRENLEDMM